MPVCWCLATRLLKIWTATSIQRATVAFAGRRQAQAHLGHEDVKQPLYLDNWDTGCALCHTGRRYRSTGSHSRAFSTSFRSGGRLRYEPFLAVRKSAARAPNKNPFCTCRAPLRLPSFTPLRFVRIRCEEQNQPDRVAKGKTMLVRSNCNSSASPEAASGSVPTTP